MILQIPISENIDKKALLQEKSKHGREFQKKTIDRATWFAEGRGWGWCIAFSSRLANIDDSYGIISIASFRFEMEEENQENLEWGRWGRIGDGKEVKYKWELTKWALSNFVLQVIDKFTLPKSIISNSWPW